MSNVITTSRRDGFNIRNTINRTEQEIIDHPAVKIAKDFYDQMVQGGWGHEFGVEVRTSHLDERWMPEGHDGFDEIEIDVFFNYDRSNTGAICRNAKNLYRAFMRAKGLRLDWTPKETWLPCPERQTIFHEADINWDGSIDRNDFITKWLADNPRGQMELFPHLNKEFICSVKEIKVWTPWDVDAP